MNIKGKGLLLVAGVLGSILAASPVLAQSHGGGGGGHAGGGGGHFSGGGHAAGGHAGGPSAHFAGGAHYAAPGRGYAGGGVHAGGYGGAYAGRGAYGGNHYYAGRPGYGGYGGYGRAGGYWRGGYWNGGFWPGAFYGAGFSWFLAGLPLAYSTYWWGGVPYYYANDAYYTYSQDYQGYVATDPPPAAGQQGDSAGSQAPEGAQPIEGNTTAPPQGGSANIYMYPKNGQSTEQQTQDRTECQSWATQQAGPVAQNGPDYQRAMVACVEGRGYSAR